jgi:hypothetical protein
MLGVVIHGLRTLRSALLATQLCEYVDASNLLEARVTDDPKRMNKRK